VSDVSPQERSELERIRRVSDMLCSGHSHLRDRCTRYAFFSDVVVLGVSTWLLALTFVDDPTATSLTPPMFSARIWLGILGALTFFVTLVRMKADWRGRADAHRRTCEMYAEVHRECGYLLAKGDSINISECQRVLARYDMATDVGTALPEAEFLSAKRRHKLKVAISKHLDEYPGSFPAMVKFVLIWKAMKSLRSVNEQ
jgi:hypothetical protein